MVKRSTVGSSPSVMKMAEGVALFLFMAVSMMPVLVILAETLASTLDAGFTMPASFIRYVNRVTGNTLLLALTVTAVSLLAGVPAGFFLARLRPRAAGIFLVLLTIPLAAPSLVSAVMVRGLFERTGFLYAWVSRPGLTLPSAYGFSGLAATQLLHTIPYTVLLTRAGFLAIPRSIEDAAYSLGASPAATFCGVLIPFVFPHILTACTMMLLYSLGDLGAPLILGGPYKVFSSEIYVNFISNWGDKRVPLVFAVWAIIVFLAVLMVMARVKALSVARQGKPDGRCPELRPGARRAGTAYLVLLSSAMLLPFLYVFTRELLVPLPAASTSLPPLVHDWSPVRSTLLLALFVVPPMLAAAVFIANAVKSRRRTVLLSGIILAPAVLPGVLLGFGLLRSLNALGPARLSTPWLVFILGVALAVRGLPYVVIVLQSAINASTIPLEDSARSLGASPAAAFFTVTLPQIRPFIAVAAVVGVFTCVTELSASLIIYPPGWQTMSMFIAYYMEEGFVRRAVFMALLLLAAVEAMLVLSGILSARSTRMARPPAQSSRDRMVFLSAFAALDPDTLHPIKPRRRREMPRSPVLLVRLAWSRLRPLVQGVARRLHHVGGMRGSGQGRLRAENAMLREELAKAEQRHLSMQINPHFFFNTLNTIVSLVQKDRDAAIGTIGKLSSLFRYALDASDSDTLPLAKEIEYIRTYLEIEKMRFGDKLHYTVAVPDGLFGAAVPPLLIQPLVENAVKYGKDADGVAYLFLSIRGERGALIVQVADYGASGAGAEDMAASEGTGLRTVRQRVEALAGGSLRFIRNKPQGLIAELRLSVEGTHGQDTDSR
ncbi:MAG TPA: histidine kinase [bacterium]|nr:histidine kinase [bacterium]